MAERTGRTVICSIVFMDIVGASKVPTNQQLEWKDRLNRLVADAIADIAEADRLVLDTGDGMALCFLGDPEDALFVGTAVNEACAGMADEDMEAFQLRTGINLGPVKLVSDLTGRPNAIGDGINVAERIMSFADQGEVLVSRSYYEVVARLRLDNEQLFRFLGTKTDKHIRKHQVYAYVQSYDDPARAGSEDGKETAEAIAAHTARPEPITRESATMAAERLSTYIGPLGKVIVQRAVPSAASVDELYNIVSAAIPDKADRALFLEETPRRKTAASPRDAQPTEPPPEEPSFTDEQLKQVETILAKHLGPLAGILVKKAARTARDRADLARRLADHIENPEARLAFLNAMGVTG